MIISRGRGYIFVHIPKTGGTAMALALEGRAMADDILIGDTPKALKRKRRIKDVQTQGRLWKHATLADAAGLITPQDLDDLMIFSLVRNPWDRMVSYYHWLQDQRFDHPAVDLAQAHDFSGFLNAKHTQRSLSDWPYGRYLRDPSGLERPCHFVRLEHLSQDLQPVEQHLGFSLSLERINVSTRDRDWRPYYSQADAGLLADLCATDIARFGYGFDPA